VEPFLVSTDHSCEGKATSFDEGSLDKRPPLFFFNPMPMRFPFLANGFPKTPRLLLGFLFRERIGRTLGQEFPR